VLAAEEIAEAEAQYGVAFPADYRSFLAEVSAGGTAAEVAHLRQAAGRWAWLWDEDGGAPAWVLDPSGPFAEDADWPTAQLAALRSADFRPGPPDDELGYRADYEAAFGDEAGGEAWFNQRGRGAIPVSDNGCGTTTWLIVTGPRSGELRYRDCAVNPPFDPELNDEGNPHTFRTWYLTQLARREARLTSR
jgi:hypothetical protein